MNKTIDIVNKFFELLGKGDFENLKTIIDEDVTFVGPIDQKKGLTEFINLLKQFGPLVQGMDMKIQFENGADVCSIYDMTIKTPKRNKSLNMAISDWIKTENGKITEQRIFYDARDFVDYMSQ